MGFMEKIYITTPAYYPNNVAHLGHAYTTIASDVLARWYRLKMPEKNVMFISGLDEHGEKLEKAAEERGMEPQKFVDMMALKFDATWKLLNISYNGFIRTSNEKHIKVVKEIFKKIYSTGDIYKGVYEDWYCTPCESFWTETQLVLGKCPECRREVKRLKEESYFFRLSKYQERILEHYKKNPGFIAPHHRKQEIINRVTVGLKDLSISRKHVKWGIPLPIDEGLTMYCWIDALSFYLSVLGYPGEMFKKFWPPDIQLMAKEILWFHAVILPALLMSAKIPLPKKVFAHGWLTVNGEKMSKSKGNFILPEAMVGKYGVDGFRYYLIKEIPFGEDGDFSEEALKARYNNELANDLGNLVSRVLTLAEKNFNKGIKKYPVEKGLAGKLNIDGVSKHMDELELHLALQGIMGFVKACNRHINNEKLWERKGDELEKHLYSLLEGIRITSLLLTPFIPESAGKINKQLGISSKSLKECKFGLVKKYNVKKEGILFKKVEGEKDVLVQNTPKLSVSPYLKKQGINVAAALITDAKVANRNSKLEGLKKDVADKILGGKIDNAKILNGYKEFYDKAGMKECVPAAENLIKLVKKGKKFPEINTIVDCYNLVSAETGLSLGAHDMNFIKGGLVFRETRGDEKFIPLGEKNPVKINKGEYAFMDEEEVLCRMDIKQGDKTKITKNTKSFIIYAQGNKNVGLDYLQKALKKACILLEKVCGAKYQTLKVE